MENKLNRIAAFIDSLPMESTLDDTQSAVLSSQLNALGGEAINKSNCTNVDVSNCSDATNNKGCVNNIGACGDATNNVGCTSKEIAPKPVTNVELGCSN